MADELNMEERDPNDLNNHIRVSIKTIKKLNMNEALSRPSVLPNYEDSTMLFF